ncbi:MAG: Hsp70 family protein [Deltaproteobacteria bacterium]|nr:Hsp70 family protein [Deltaproteobacteria bacterium]
MDAPTLGLDFGTSKTVAAWVDSARRVHLVAVGEGGHALPSVLSYQGKRGSTVLGDAAQRLSAVDPKRTVVGLKRFLGRRFKSDFVQRNRQRFLFPLVEAPDGSTAVELRGEVMSLERVASRLLSEMVDHANASLGRAFEACVVACPAHFTLRQRQALRRVVERCGLEVRAMILEPTAAAMTLPEPEQGRTLLVYDLGGGTFDTTVLRVEEGVVHVLATGGDAFLGGFDIDTRLAEGIIGAFRDETGIDLNTNAQALQALSVAVEKAKIELSEHPSARVQFPFIDDKRGFINVDRPMTRHDLETWAGPLLERTIGIVQETLAAAAVSMANVDELVLVGGQTRMPYLRRRIEDALGKRPTDAVDPTTCVAVGAAVLGAGEHMLFDAVSVPLYAAMPGRPPVELLARGAAVPAVCTVGLGDNPAGVVYEAFEATAVDRDVLARLSPPPAWRQQHVGPYGLRASLSASFKLTLDVVAADGARADLALDDGGPSMVPVGQAAAPVPLTDEGTLAAMSVLVRVLPAGTPVALRTLRVGQRFASIVAAPTERPPTGALLELTFRHGREVVQATAVAGDAVEPTTFLATFRDPQTAERLARLLGAQAT